MLINSIKEYNIQNNNPNFKAKLQISGNTTLITNGGINKLKEVTNKIGSETDIIDIALPMSNRFIKNKANINIAGSVNGMLKQFSHRIEKTNILEGVIAGLKKAKEIFSGSDQASRIDMNDSQTQHLLSHLYFLVGNQDYINIRKVPNYRKDFLKLGEHINDPLTRFGDTAIFYVAKYGKEELLELLLDHPDINVNVQNILGDTPLHKASENGHDKCLELLLKRKDVDRNIKNNFGFTAEEVYHGKNEYVDNVFKKYKPE